MEDLNIRKIVTDLGGSGEAARLTVNWQSPLKRQTIESWFYNNAFPAWRAPDVKRLASLAKQSSKPQPKRKRA